MLSAKKHSRIERSALNFFNFWSPSKILSKFYIAYPIPIGSSDPKRYNDTKVCPPRNFFILHARKKYAKQNL